jgi:hypothetical protein
MKQVNRIISKGLPPIATTIGGIVIFPVVKNRHLLQSKINVITIYVIILVIGFSISYCLQKTIARTFRRRLAIGIPCLLISCISLFALYYPYANESILKLKSECGGDFVKGTKLNWQKLNRSDSLILDSLATASPEKLVQYANCDPENAWTLSSIEDQFSGILYRAAITVFFFAVGFDLITKVLTGSR